MSKGWTEERRQQQAERIRQTKPWEKATGPKSKGGKQRSKYNALKHGKYSEKNLELRAALWKQYDALSSLAKAMKKDPALERALNELRKKRLESITKIAENFSPQQTEEKRHNAMPTITPKSSPRTCFGVHTINQIIPKNSGMHRNDKKSV